MLIPFIQKLVMKQGRYDQPHKNKKGRGANHDPKNIEFKPTMRMQLHLSMSV